MATITEKKFVSKENMVEIASRIKTYVDNGDKTQAEGTTALQKRVSANETAIEKINTTLPNKLEADDLKTINGQKITGSGDLSLADIGIDGEIAKVVSELPAASEAVSNKLYLVKSANAGTDNVYAEYIKVMDGTTAKWEKIGEWKGYITVDDAMSDQSINPVQNKVVKKYADDKFVAKVTGKDLSTNDFTTALKTKLEGIAEGANNYTLPLAANGTKGGIQIGYSQNGKNYPVALSSEKAYVNVPWTDQNVYQAVLPDSDNSAYPILGSAKKTLSNGEAAQSVYLKGLTYTPNGSVLSVGTGKMVAKTFTGNLTGTASEATHAGSADIATSATNAINDASGNAIEDTYLKTADFNSKFTELTDTDLNDIWAKA